MWCSQVATARKTLLPSEGRRAPFTLACILFSAGRGSPPHYHEHAVRAYAMPIYDRAIDWLIMTDDHGLYQDSIKPTFIASPRIPLPMTASIFAHLTRIISYRTCIPHPSRVASVPVAYMAFSRRLSNLQGLLTESLLAARLHRRVDQQCAYVTWTRSTLRSSDVRWASYECPHSDHFFYSAYL